MKNRANIATIVKFFIFHFSFFISLSSCMDEPVRDSATQEERDLTFSMRIPGGGASTRALSIADEMQITSVSVLVLDPITDKFLYLAPGKIQPGSGSTRSFTVTLRTGTFDLIVLANAATAIAESYPTGIPPGEDRADIEQTLLASLADGTKWKTTTSDFTPLPFWGDLPGSVIDENTDLTTSPLSLRRTVAAIDVKVAPAAQANFTLESIYLYNPNTSGALIPDPALYIAGNPSVAGLPSTIPLIYSGSDLTTTGIASEGVIYTFEAIKGTTQDFRKNTCLVVGGTYKGAGPYYYRIDFRQEASDGTLTYLPLLRNNRYTVTIQQAEYAGWPTPEEAFNALPVSIQAEVSSWEEGYDQDQDIEQNTFKVSQSLFSYPALNEEDEGVAFTGFFTVKSSQDWSYELSKSPTKLTGMVGTWFTHTRSSGSAGEEIINFSVKENIGGKRSVYLHCKSGNLTYVVEVTQKGLPNSYMIKPGETIEFPIRKAYMVWADEVMGNQQQTISGAVECELIWQDTQSLLDSYGLNADGDQGTQTKLQVTAGSKVGNALIGVRIGGTRRYSWHIWITDYDPETEANGFTQLHNNGYSDYVFMDRNLGATTNTPAQLTTHGFQYQFGRKDPFPGAAALTGIADNTNSQKALYNSSNTSITKGNTLTPGTTGYNNNIHLTLLNPLNFYRGLTTERPLSDWYTTQTSTIYQNDYLWSDKDGDKATFDPCPEGWRVPIGVKEFLPWEGFTTSNFPWTPAHYGSTYNGNFYPAAGTIHFGMGTIYNIETGIYWAALTWDMHGTKMSFSSEILYLHQSTGRRSSGAFVRCVKE